MLNRLTALMAEQLRDTSPQKPHVVQGFCRRPYRGTTARLWNRSRHCNGRRNPFNTIRIGFVELLQKLSRVRRKTFDVSPLPLRVERVQSEARLSTAAHPANHHEFTAGDIQVDISQIMDADAPQMNRWFAHAG